MNWIITKFSIILYLIRDWGCQSVVGARVLEEVKGWAKELEHGSYSAGCLKFRLRM